MTLVHAKHVVITAKQSSFAMWAVLANTGNVYLPKLNNQTGYAISDGLKNKENLHFFNDKYGEGLVYYDTVERLLKELNISVSDSWEVIEHIENPEMLVLNWLNDENDSVNNEAMFE